MQLAAIGPAVQPLVLSQGAGEETAESIEAHERLMARAAERGFSEWDIRGPFAFGELDLMLGDGSTELSARSDTTVWLRLPGGRLRHRPAGPARRGSARESEARPGTSTSHHPPDGRALLAHSPRRPWRGSRMQCSESNVLHLPGGRLVIVTFFPAVTS